MLAREGMGVCVAEQAALPGGCLQSFSRRGHAIDTGMHYIGSMQAGGIMRRYFEYFGILGSLRLRPLDEAFDVVSLPSHIVLEALRADPATLEDKLCYLTAAS